MAQKYRSLKAMLAATMLVTGTLSLPGLAIAHEPYFRDAPSPECSDPKMLRKIVKRFSIQAKHVHHRKDWAIKDFSGIHQHRYLPQDVHRARAIARRYCHATAWFNDGGHRKIWYLIEGGAGFASYSDNVEFCISGLDHWNVYNAHCRLLR